jgi:glycosyltransferase involved in cell wall biosynthesis
MNNDMSVAAGGEMISVRNRLLIATTVPETLATILKLQPRYLANFFDVSLVTSPGDSLEQVAQNEGLAIFEVPMARGISVLNDLVSVVRMMLVLRAVRPMLVQSYTPKAGLVCMLAAWLCRVPIRVHTFTGLISPTAIGMKQQLLIWVDRLICACATHIVPEGEGVKNDLQRLHITRKPLHVIGYGNIAGVETTHFSPMAVGVEEAATQLRQTLSIQAEDFLFCFVGRLNKDKGLAELIGAFKGLSPTAHLVLVGGVDQTAPVDAATLAAIESHPRVHQLGFLGDIRPALQAADVLVLPSYREGFPNVVLQAGSMGLPVIATNINGCNEVVEPGYNGWLVPPRDTRALEDSMRQAMETPASVRAEMGQQGRVRIQQRFERKQHWERMVVFYQALLDRHKKA